VREAAIKIKQQLLDMAAKDLKVDPATLAVEGGQIVSTGGKKVKITDVSGLKDRMVIVGVAHAGANPPGKRVKPFCAHFCEVEVNMKTMEVKVLRYLAAHESGRVICKVGYEGQLAGGVTQGIGLGLSEARVFDRQTGKLLTTNMRDYKVPTIKDVATDMEYLLIDKNDTFSSTGAKGVGEPPKVPPAAAVANAVYHATGIRFTKSPINPLQLGA
jgi:xanthine dehydrogenase YagR molybdenum-binding subunit